MKRIKTGLTGFILGDWLGMPYRGKGKGTFKPMWTKSYLRGDKCSGNTSMLLCALDSRCNLELYQQNLRDWYFNRKYTGENIEFDIDQVTQKAIMKTCEAAINIIGKSVREMVNLAGLDSVDFALFNISAVKQNIEENPNKLPGLMIFAGSDDTYEYSISATPSYSGKNEYPEEVMALLLRKNIENPIDDFCVFNFNDKKWVKADFAAHLGLTREK